jgi:hypothetical protein
VKSAEFARQSSIPFPDAVLDQRTNAIVGLHCWDPSLDRLRLEFLALLRPGGLVAADEFASMIGDSYRISVSRSPAYFFFQLK